jgi:thiamine biosynthesis lipoprotein
MVTGEASDRRDGLQAIEAAFQAIARREELLSTWREDSPLSVLNRRPAGAPLVVPPDLLGALGRARELWRLSNGAFDPAVGRLVGAYDLRGAGRLPGPEELAAARAASGMELLVLDPAAGTVLKRPPGPLLDAGGFGKGDALVHAAHALRDSGLERWLIDFGGQVLSDPLGGRRAVRVADPGQRDRPVVEIVLPAGTSAATSAVSERPGHILDPRTGRPAADFGAVTVISRDALRADALSTALFVLGPEEGLQLAEETEDLEALFLVRGSAGLRLRWTSGMGPLINRDKQMQEAGPRPRPESGHGGGQAVLRESSAP